MATPARLSVHLLSVGSCRHCERITLRGASLKPARFPSICALIIHPQQGALLYDTGYAEHFMHATTPFPERLYRWLTPVSLPPDESLASQLSALGVELEDIRLCLISHFHADHIAGLRDLPRARFMALQADVTALRAGHRYGRLMHGWLPALLPEDFYARLDIADHAPRRRMGVAWSRLGEGFDLFGDGSLLALALPGHAPGQMGLRLRDPFDREVLLCADACWSRAAWESLRLPSPLARLAMVDWTEYHHTLWNLHDLGQRYPELAIVPSHCAASLAAYRNPVASMPSNKERGDESWG